MLHRTIWDNYYFYDGIFGLIRKLLILRNATMYNKVTSKLFIY
jgi:hypothetical protein